MENYKIIKRELYQLLLEGDNLLEDDKSLDSVLSSLDSQGIMRLVRDLKENGNSLFEQRQFEDALEKYGFAGAILANYDFVDDDVQIECVHLAISILLNSTACFGKKSDFEQVGGICTIVLDVEPKNVKVVYGRAMAAIVLGRSDLAYWDLCIAAEIERRNKEVITKLQEIKHTLNNNSKHYSGDGGPIGLDSCLAAPWTKSVKPPEQNESGMMKEMQRSFSIMQSLDSMDKLRTGNIPPPSEEKSKEKKKHDEKEKVEDKVMVGKAEAEETREMEVNTVEKDDNFQTFNPKISNLAKSMY